MESIGLVVGLGNPGTKYDLTRHNLGFICIDYVLENGTAEGYKFSCGTVKTRTPCVLNECRDVSPDGRVLLAKPKTYMNRSGLCVRALADMFDLSAERLLVVHDELDLPPGRMKLKFGGGAAGHNGIRSIIDHLGTRDFYRLRLGIGKPEFGETTNHVLGKISVSEQEAFHKVLPAAAEGIRLLFVKGFQTALEYVNGFRLPSET